MKKYFALILGGLCLFNSCGGGSSAPPPPPTLRLAPASLTFGVLVVGTTSGAQVEMLTNTGSSELAISGVAITGHGFQPEQYVWVYPRRGSELHSERDFHAERAGPAQCRNRHQ